MEKAREFTSKIQQSYAPEGGHIYLGAGILDGQILPDAAVNLPLSMMNRHGLIAGATGTGKTRTLQLIAEQLSDAGVPVFLLDVKGDLSGLALPADRIERLEERAAALKQDFVPSGFPVELYSLSGKEGAQMRATVLEFGPVLLSKILGLNDTQAGVLAMIFKYADDNRLPLVDLADLKKLVDYLSTGEGAAGIRAEYGTISQATAGTILRKIVTVEQQGLGQLFGEPSFDIGDLFRQRDGRGLISLLNISDVQTQPVLFSTFLLSLVAEIFNGMPETGDTERPKLVFFIDEAHLLFKGSSPAFLGQIETVIRLIRSKGIGIFLCTQSPTDIPETVLAQLGNRIQHALRTFTPNDAESLRKTVKTYPTSAFYDLGATLTSLGTGQALITVLNEKGIPTEVVATHLSPPRAVMGGLPEDEYAKMVSGSSAYARYKDAVNRESAYEMLAGRLSEEPEEDPERSPARSAREKTGKSALEKVLGAPLTRQIGREIVRGLFGMLTGRKSRRRGGLFGL